MAGGSDPGASQNGTDLNSASLPNRAEQQKVIKSMVEQGARLLGAESALVMMHRPGFGDFVLLDCSYGATPGLLDLRVPLHEAPIGPVFADGTSVALSQKEAEALQTLFGIPVKNALL